jgi:hypothetical protein
MDQQPHFWYMDFGATMRGLPNQITTANAGWRTQFRFRGSRYQPGVCEFQR